LDTLPTTPAISESVRRGSVLIHHHLLELPLHHPMTATTTKISSLHLRLRPSRNAPCRRRIHKP
jgi:hypothetical protein